MNVVFFAHTMRTVWPPLRCNVLEAIVYLVAATLTVSVFFAILGFVRHKRRQRLDAQRLQQAERDGVRMPASLHPVVDSDRCSGCLTCLAICPEGDLFGVVDNKAVLIEGSRCIGHGACAEACPTGAISLVFGSKERGLDLPETDACYETARDGVYVVGELGGMGLIKNAVKQGLEVAHHLKTTIERAREADKDVAIVGAGPAGIAAALGCKEAGLSFRIFDQNRRGGAIAAYPRHKVVMSEKLQLPLYGPFGERVMRKEELIATLDAVLHKAQISIHERVKLLDVHGQNGAFHVITDHGSFTARKVVLAVGRRGTPRKLEVPGEDKPKVTYALDDAAQYDSRHVLVVGGGDAALEAAIALGQEPNVHASLSYRGKSFGRARAANREKIADLNKRGRVRLIMESEVIAIEDAQVRLRNQKGQKKWLRNDYVIVCIGGTLPTALLDKLHIRLRRHHGLTQTPSHQAGAAQRPPMRALIVAIYGVAGATAVALLAWGWGYYTGDAIIRLRSDLHRWLRPSGLIGHGIGVVATLLLAFNYLYGFRKRWPWLQGIAMPLWIGLHTAIGISGPALIFFHSAFQSRNLLATTTAALLALVVLTGMVGRYLFGFLPRSPDARQPTDLNKLQQQQMDNEHTLITFAQGIHRSDVVLSIANQISHAVPARGGFLAVLLTAAWQRRRVKRQLVQARLLWQDAATYELFCAQVMAQQKLRLQIILYQRIRQLFSRWRVFHAALAWGLAGVVTAHIVVSIYLGYGWVFF